MKNIFAIIIFTFLSKFCLAQLGTNPPFSLSLEKIQSPPMPGFHSFAFAQSGQYWLIVGGRTNGLHGINPNSSFAPEDANNAMVVIDTTTWLTYSSSLSNLTYAVADPLRSTNTQYFQDGNSLFVCGGYGRDSIQNKFVTFPVLSHIQVDSVIDAIVNGQNISPFIKQLTDTNYRICGGELQKINNMFYLIMGHDFNGRYDQQAQSPMFTQKYSNQIRVFNIQYNTGVLTSALITAREDTVNFHRRDLNVFPIMNNFGKELMAFGGVFKKDKDFPFLEPVQMGASDDSVFIYSQIMHHYTCAGFSAYDSISQLNHITFFGGMSFNNYDETINTLVNDTLVPFVNDVTTFSFGNGFYFQENVHPQLLKSLQGTNTKFVWRKDKPFIADDVLHLNKLNQRTMIGYLFGGIYSDSPNNSPNTVANDTIWRVYLNPTPLAVKNKSNDAQIQLEVNPQPAKNELNIVYVSPTNAIVNFILINAEGKTLLQEKRFLNQGNNKITINLPEIKSGSCILKAETASSSVSKKCVIQQ